MCVSWLVADQTFQPRKAINELGAVPLCFVIARAKACPFCRDFFRGRVWLTMRSKATQWR